MPSGIASGLVGRAAGMALLLGGFWLLASGISHSNILQGLVGGVMIPTSMWVIVSSRRKVDHRSIKE